MTTYSCAQCGLAVVVLDGEIIKACQCDAAVVGEMSAVAHGTSGVAGS